MVQSSVPREQPTHDVVAYREYLQARGIMIRPTEQNLLEVVRLTEDVIARDPDFAQAYAVLGGANLMFLDNGYTRPDALARAEPAIRKAVSLNPRLPGAQASLGVIAAHRLEWLAAEAHFARAFELDDGSGRIPARYAEAVLNSTGRLRAALQIFESQLRLTPTHPRAAMQLAIALGMQPGNDSEATRYVDIGMTHGWPGNSSDVQKLTGDIARRAGRFAEAADYEALALPESIRQAGGAGLVRLLYAALAEPARRPEAIAALDALTARDAPAELNSFSMLMFSMNWYTMLGDLDRAYLTSERWLRESARLKLAGLPFLTGLWLPEMREFRADPRFSHFAERLGFLPYWRKHGAPDGCRLAAAALQCAGQ
jgi:tetratricopeptide (TPR) repeat protein